MTLTIFLDGVYLPGGEGPPVFRYVPAPTAAQLRLLVQQIAERIGKLLEKRGLIECDMENAWLTADGPGGALDDLIGHPSPTGSRSVPAPGRSCSRDRRCRPAQCSSLSGKAIAAVLRRLVDSPGTPASTSSLISVRSSNDCGVT